MHPRLEPIHKRMVEAEKEYNRLKKSGKDKEAASFLRSKLYILRESYQFNYWLIYTRNGNND